MTLRLLNCQVDKLEEGMVIAKDVIIGSGALFFDAGTVLNEENIKILIKENIKYVSVESSNVKVKKSDPIESEIEKVRQIATPPQKAENVIDRKRQMFRDCIDDQFMGKLYEIVCIIDSEG